MATVTSSKRHLVLTSDTYTSNGNVVVGGDLTIQGTTTTLDTANLLVEDKNIIIGNVSSPTDTTANGGGITLKGASDKTISWSNANNRWDFNQGITSSGDITAANISGSTSGNNTGDQDLSDYLTSLPSHNHDGRYLRTHARYSDDLDTITTSGVYIWDVSEADDEPTGAADGLLTIKYWDSSYWATASFQDFHNRTLHIKSKKNGTWQSDWAQVWTTDQLTTTNKTNYDTAYTHSQADHAPTNAEQNVQADWTAADGDAHILNKPSTFAPSAHTHNIISNDSTNSIDVVDHSSHTWLRNSVGTWSFQTGTGGDDWSQTFGIHLPAAGSTANAVMMELGQRDSNQADGRYKGVRIVNYTGSTVTDGHLQVGTIAANDGTSANWNTAYTHSQAAHAPTNAEQNVQANWTATSGDAHILNKPTIPSGNSILDWTADQGSSNIHANNIVGYINTTEPNEPFNPFAGQKFHDGVLTNALVGRHDRFVVTIDGTTEAGASYKLSNQNFEEYNQNRLFGTSAGETRVFNINIQSLATGSPSSSGITYSAGFFDINFYSSPFPASWSARVKNKDSNWYNVTNLTKIGNSKLRGVIPIGNWLTDIEFTLTARTSAPFVTGNITYGISEFELFFSRMAASQGGNISSLGGYLGGTITTASGTTSTNWNTAYTHSQAAHAPTNAEQNVQADWTAADGDAHILNKPTIPTVPDSYAPTDAEANVQANWTAADGDAHILNKPSLLAIGTTSTTALAGDTALLAIGTSATTALAGNTSIPSAYFQSGNTGDVGSGGMQNWNTQESTPSLNPTTDWFTSLRIGHGNPVSYYSNTLGIQMTGGDSGRIYTRTIAGGTAGSWKKYYHTGDFATTDFATSSHNHDSTYVKLTGSGEQEISGDVLFNDTVQFDGDVQNMTSTTEVRIETSGGEMLVLKDTNSVGDASTPYIGFYDSANTRQGYVGMGSGSNAKLYLEGLDGIQANNPISAPSLSISGNVGVYGIIDSYTGITTSGTVTAIGGNSGEWNTAHGWGNHADAGYTGDQNLSGYLTTTGKAADSELIDGIDSSRIVYGANAKRSTRYDGAGIADPNQNSGFFYGHNPDGGPTTDWTNWMTTAGASWATGNNYSFTFAHPFHSDILYVARMTNGAQGSWRQILDTSTTQTITGVKTFNSMLVNGNSTVMGTLNVGSAADGAQRDLILHGSSVNKQSRLRTTDGNLHIDSAEGHSLYLNYYYGATTNIYFGSGNGGSVGSISSSGLLRMANDIVAYYSFSDKRLKTDIKSTEGNLDKILSLNPVEYTWKEGPRKGVKEIGLIAQEVEEIVPEVVRVQSRHDNETGDGIEYKQVDYEHLVSTLIGAMQEQQKQIDELKSMMCKCKK